MIGPWAAETSEIRGTTKGWGEDQVSLHETRQSHLRHHSLDTAQSDPGESRFDVFWRVCVCDREIGRGNRVLSHGRSPEMEAGDASRIRLLSFAGRACLSFLPVAEKRRRKFRRSSVMRWVWDLAVAPSERIVAPSLFCFQGPMPRTTFPSFAGPNFGP